MNNELTFSKLTALRKELESSGVDGFIVPRSDEYQGEFVAEYAERLAWATNFTGSAGLAIILKEQCCLFVDGRYILQAGHEVDLQQFKIKHISELSPETWLGNTIEAGQKIGFDPHLHTSAQIRKYRRTCEKVGANLIALSDNPIDAVWLDQPTRPKGEVSIQPASLTGLDRGKKLEYIRKFLLDEACDSLLITSPESLCWFLNIRGSDVRYTPIIHASMIVKLKGKSILFVDAQKMNQEVTEYLGDNVIIAPEEALIDQFSEWFGDTSRMAVDAATISEWYNNCFCSRGLELKPTTDPCILPKACKNEAELNGIRSAHVRDGVALTSFLAWFYKSVSLGGITELSASERLENFRKLGANFVGPSFPTIAGFSANGAIIHYRPTEDSNTVIEGNSLFLVDSGGQYIDGTTDVTRTLLVGEPNSEHIERFTQVLKGHIALASVRFPEGTTGGQLDALARLPLWKSGLDYDHGTGHGVGAFLNVHEGPQSISKGSMGPPLQAGMVISNEPGYYKSGCFGIRIENLVAVVPAKIEENGKKFLEFETLTLAPLDQRLINSELLTNFEKAWVNDYHQHVYETLSNALDMETRSWLQSATLPLL